MANCPRRTQRRGLFRPVQIEPIGCCERHGGASGHPLPIGPLPRWYAGLFSTPHALVAATSALRVMPFSGIFVSLVGNPEVVMPHYQARIIKFPVHRNAIAELRAEVEEIKKLLVRA